MNEIILRNVLFNHIRNMWLDDAQMHILGHACQLQINEFICGKLKELATNYVNPFPFSKNQSLVRV